MTQEQTLFNIKLQVSDIIVEPITPEQLYDTMSYFDEEQRAEYEKEYKQMCNNMILKINADLKANFKNGYVTINLFTADLLTKNKMHNIPDKYVSDKLNITLMKSVWQYIQIAYASFNIEIIKETDWCIFAKIHIPNACTNVIKSFM